MLQEKADPKAIKARRRQLCQESLQNARGAGCYVSHRQLRAYALEPFRWGVKFADAPGVEPLLSERANQLLIERGSEQAAVQSRKALAGSQHQLLVSE